MSVNFSVSHLCQSINILITSYIYNFFFGRFLRLFNSNLLKAILVCLYHRLLPPLSGDLAINTELYMYTSFFFSFFFDEKNWPLFPSYRLHCTYLVIKTYFREHAHFNVTAWKKTKQTNGEDFTNLFKQIWWRYRITVCFCDLKTQTTGYPWISCYVYHW